MATFILSKYVRMLLAKGVVDQDAFWEIFSHPASVFSANSHLYIGSKKKNPIFVN
jgi:hypothetical protein